VGEVIGEGGERTRGLVKETVNVASRRDSSWGPAKRKITTEGRKTKSVKFGGSNHTGHKNEEGDASQCPHPFFEADVGDRKQKKRSRFYYPSDVRRSAGK